MNYKPLLFIALGFASGVGVATVSERPRSVAKATAMEPLESHIVSRGEGGGAKYEMRPITVSTARNAARVLDAPTDNDTGIAQVYFTVDGTRYMTQYEVVELR